jgi:hypothetical protein
VLLNVEGEREALQHQLDSLKRHRQDEHSNASTRKGAKRPRTSAETGDNVEGDDEYGSSDEEEDNDRPAGKKTGQSAAAKRLDEQMKRFAKKLTIMGAVWPPSRPPEMNGKRDVLEMALDPSVPFPETEPDPLCRYESNNFDAQYSSFRWEIRRNFGSEILEKYAKKDWFYPMVSPGPMKKMCYISRSRTQQVREAMSDRRSEMSTRINVAAKETIHGSDAIEAAWDVRKFALGYTPPKDGEESGCYEAMDAPVLHRLSSPSEWAANGSAYIPGKFLLSDQVMRVRIYSSTSLIVCSRVT